MKKLLSVILLFSIIVSCTKTITPALNNGATQLVIQGAISDTPGPYYVQIVNSVGFYALNSYPGLSGAAITITDATAGVRDSLTETSAPGTYVTHTITQGFYGHTYQLLVSLNGKTYTASSTMPQLVKLDSVTFDYSNGNNQIGPIANFQDPAGIFNDYKFNLVINGVVDARFQTFEDRLSDGRYIRERIDVDTGEIKPNFTVELCLVGIDSNVDTYLSEAAHIAYNNGSLAAPATPTSNISGGCLGYFSAQTVSSKTAAVK
jgi:hypothetical protein